VHLRERSEERRHLLFGVVEVLIACVVFWVKTISSTRRA